MQILIETHRKNGQLGNAYLFEGEHMDIFPKLLATLKTLGFSVERNPDIWSGVFENFGIDDARNIAELGVGSPFAGSDRFFLLFAGALTLEAQNALLKTFEDTRKGAHFFLVVPRRSILLPTLASRCVFVATEKKEEDGSQGPAKDFFSLSRAKRLKVLESIVKEKDKALAAEFLNALEEEARKSGMQDVGWFGALYRAKRSLGFRGASVKLILEGLALSAPQSK